MTGLRVLASRILAAIFRGRRDAVLDEEIRSHLDHLTEEHLRRGLSLPDARAAARREFGGIDPMKEAYRDQRGVPLLSALAQDVRFGLRMLRKSPGFTLVAVASLALGIGANTAIFSLVNAALLEDLPVRDPDTLASLTAFERSSRRDLSYPMFRDVASRQQVLSEMAASGGMSLDRVRVEGAAQDLEGVDGAFVSANYFTMLGVRASIGRVFTGDDSRAPGEGAVAVLGHGLWERQFGRDPAIVGRTLTLNRAPFTVIGVAERGFFGDRVGTVRDLWVPILMQPRVQPRDMLERRTATWFQTIGRLKPGIGEDQARAALTALFQQLKAEEISSGTGSLIHRSQPSDFRVELQSGSRGLNVFRERFQKPLVLLTAVMGLVLSIACCNVANLLLARAAARQREIGIRLALGSSRRRLVGQLLTESMLLSLAGAALGLVVAQWTSDFLIAHLAIGRLDYRLDARALAFTLAVAVATAILFGLVPALQATSVDPGRALAASSARQAGSRPRKRVSKTLVAAQVALSVWLLIGAGLLLRSLQNLRELDVGVDRAHLLTLSVSTEPGAVASAELPDLRRRLLEGLQRIPGVASASFSAYSLFSGSATTAPVRVPGSTVDPEKDGEVRQNWVTAGYFDTLGLRSTVGRGFTESDSEKEARVAVINATMARHYFGDESPLGKVIYFPRVDAQGRYIPFGPQLNQSHGVEVVGVVEDAKYDNLRSPTPRMAYLPMPRDGGSLRSIEVRTEKDPNTIAPHLRRVFTAVDARLVLRGTRTMEEQIDRTLAPERLFTSLLGFFGALALVLACVGVYGVMSHAVAGRTSEIGIRMALGAGRSDVVALVLREMLLLVAIGVAAGIPAALATTRFLESLLFGLSPADPIAIGGAAALMFAVAAIAGLVPAGRAARVDPMVALRSE